MEVRFSNDVKRAFENGVQSETFGIRGMKEQENGGSCTVRRENYMKRSYISCDLLFIIY
jgi:hypothetical protein